MDKIICFSIWLACLSVMDWHNNLQEAKEVAGKEHKHILLNFSGSDWCGPCIRLRKEIFDKDVFKKMADSQLILVNADFPRMKKNKLTPQQQQLNDAMADQYNAQGKFPYTVLMNADGKVLKAWDGFPEMAPEEFSKQVESIIDVDQYEHR
jgi:thioredoxin-related protein